MIQIEFKYNDNAHYQPRSVFKVKTVDIINQNIMVTSDGKSFKVSFLNVPEKYVLPYVKSDALVPRWRTDPMLYWQNQLNFAVYCAITGCGADFNNHLKDTGLIGSLLKFHIYYQIRRILKQMNIALPQDTSWNAFDNSYDRSAYERICNEFNVDVNADWRQSQSDNQGLGRIYNYWTGGGYQPFDLGVEYDKKRFSFTHATGNGIIHIDCNAQGSAATILGAVSNESWYLGTGTASFHTCSIFYCIKLIFQCSLKLCLICQRGFCFISINALIVIIISIKCRILKLIKSTFCHFEFILFIFENIFKTIKKECLQTEINLTLTENKENLEASKEFVKTW